MASRISPEDNRIPLLLKPQPFADKIPSIPIPIPIPIPSAMDVTEVGRKTFPVNLITGTELGVKVRPEGEWMDVVMVEPALAKASNQAVQTAIGYKAGGGKLGSVIPKKRKLVKTMIYHSVKDFVISLFRPSPSADVGTEAPS